MPAKSRDMQMLVNNDESIGDMRVLAQIQRRCVHAAVHVLRSTHAAAILLSEPIYFFWVNFTDHIWSGSEYKICFSLKTSDNLNNLHKWLWTSISTALYKQDSQAFSPAHRDTHSHTHTHTHTHARTHTRTYTRTHKHMHTFMYSFHTHTHTHTSSTVGSTSHSTSPVESWPCS